MENGTVRIEIYGDKAPKIESNGAEGRQHQGMDSVAGVRFRNEMESIDHELEENKEKYFKPEFLSLMQIVENLDRDSLPRAYVDSIEHVMDFYYDNERESYTDEGWKLFLIDRDGTILSTSTDAEELEPLIKKALIIE